jgi:sugar phosphate isomerase/epimerase
MTSSPFSADAVGLCVSTLRVRPADIDRAIVEQTVRAAAEAGFPSLALQVNWVTCYGIEEMAHLLDDLGLTAGALEGSVAWAEGPDAANGDADRLLDVAAGIGATLLHAACIAPEGADLPEAVEGFAALCERAGAYDIDVSHEFIPWYAYPSLEADWALVSEAGAPNGGVCIDLMHWHRQPGGPDLEALAAIPPERITYVQLTDAPPTGTVASADEYMAECMSSRPIPGDGVVDVRTLLDALIATGADPYVAYQVCNPTLAGEGSATMAARLRANVATLLP